MTQHSANIPRAVPLRRKEPRPNPGVSFETGMLIIDGDRRASVALSFMLNLRGYDEIRAVRSAARAVIIAENFSPGIVFLDIELPDTDTLELANVLRRSSGQKNVRLIALTSTVEHPLRERARQAGFERFLVKPCEQAEVDKVLRLPTENSA
jgi:two-component system CheB/CheR fusion protein